MAAAQVAPFSGLGCTTSVRTSIKQKQGRNMLRLKPAFAPLKQSKFSMNPVPALRAQKSKASITAMAESGLVRKVTAKELDALLGDDRECPIVIDFYATWCGPCVMLSKELELLAADYGETVKFLKVDTDEEYELASQMQIQGLPTLIFVSSDPSKNAIRTEGLLPADVIRNIIENEL